MERESGKLDRDIDKIRRKEIEVQKATSDVNALVNDLNNLNVQVAEMKTEVQEFKYTTLKAALIKLNEYEKTYSDKLQEIFPEREKLISSIPAKVKIEAEVIEEETAPIVEEIKSEEPEG